MAAHRVFPASRLCNACRSSILSRFTSSAGARSHPSPSVGVVRPTSRPVQLIKGRPVRGFAWSSRLQSEQEETASEQSLQAAEDNTLEPETGRTSGDQAVVDEQLPWYLQVQTPQPAISPLLARQIIPELPLNSPDLLQPLLEHISLDLGIDNLTLFDLRELDPPPALGANLLMVLGTARSEKHLHVSADRLCRWLRTTHKLSPFADGLLGRNELKLKMRRKARRTKLLSSVGASERENSDDGIRTGWICVNVGQLESRKGVAEDLQERDGIVGFGSNTGGVRIVVQMLTEEKRNEIDLEGLWGGMLERKARRKAKKDGLPYQSPESVASDSSSHDLERQTSSLKSAKLTRFLPMVDTVQPSQRRAFHSMARSKHPTTAQSSVQDYDEFGMPSVEPRIQHAHESNPQRDFGAMMPPADHNDELSVHERLADSEKSPSQVGEGIILRALLKHLKDLPNQDAREVLGKYSSDVSSTSFLVSFHAAFPAVPSSSHWECKIKMYCYAVELGHPGYPKSALLELFIDVQASGADMSAQIMRLVFETILNGRGVGSSGIQRPTTQTDIDMAMYVLESMSTRGYNVVREDIFVLLHEAVYSATRIVHSLAASIPETVSEEAMNDQSVAVARSNKEIKKAQTRLRDIMEAYKVYFTEDDSYIRILRLYAIQGHWDEFWDTWDDLPRRLQPRSKALYEFMFRTIAQTGNQKECMQTLRAWIHEMEREQPPVSLTGSVAGAVLECLLVADPWVADDAESEGAVNGEWVRLWRRCEQGLKS